MVKIALQIKASLESIEKLYTNHPHYQWFLKLKCGSCGEVSEKFHDLTEADKVPQKHNRSETNLLIKCKLCSRENSIDVIEGSNAKKYRPIRGKNDPQPPWWDSECAAMVSFRKGAEKIYNKSMTVENLMSYMQINKQTKKIIKAKKKQYGPFTSDDGNKFKTIVVFDCRGVEPVDFEPKSGWIAEAENDGKKFDDVDLSEKEWVDYDEKNQASVGIYELEWQFIKVK